jgi:phenylacetate-CoA ligase
MTAQKKKPGHASAGDIDELVSRLIPDPELAPGTVDQVAQLPSFLSKMRACESAYGLPYGEIDHAVQDALVLRRLQQMVNTVLLNSSWRSRLAGAGVTRPPQSFAEWQDIPLADKNLQRDFLMGTRPGMVVPLNRGDFEIVASGGTSSGLPVEIVYSLRELRDTYEIAGVFIGTYMLDEHLRGNDPKWLFTTLADYQMWSSGTMVGGVLQQVPGVNYVGAGPVTSAVFQHMFSYPGPKALMGISAGIAILTELGAGMDLPARQSFRVAMYGSGMLAPRRQVELKALYPNLAILSYFAATQAETIGLQRSEESPFLATVPGLHLVEIVDDQGRWVAEGEEGELVVTRLHAHETPLLRLKLGDRAVRRPRTDGPGLKTQQFEFLGRSGDVLHLGDTQFSAPRAYAALSEAFKTANVVDLGGTAYEVQFTNQRDHRLLTLTAAVDDIGGLTQRMHQMLGPHGVQHLFTTALPRALSLFNDGDSDAGLIMKTGYRFEMKFVHRTSTDLERTAVGKIPLVRDRC